MFGKKRATSSTIVGKWMGRVNGESVGMEFLDDGRLAYVVLSPDGKSQVMRMLYRVDGDVLVTDQPSHPREERSKFRIDGEELIISFGGDESRFRRSN
jgi:hypothetical protein